MLRTVKSLRGFHLGAIDGEIGHVKEFYFDDVTWKIRYLIADTGKWLALRKVLISPHALGPIDENERILHVQLTRDQVEKSPSIDADKPISRQFEERYFTYYGWPMYWADPLFLGASFTPVMNAPSISDEHADPHLRNTNEAIGYHIQANDDEVGHVEDFRIEDDDWSIHDLIVDTRNWLPGKRVLVPVDYIKNISWEKSKVFVDTSRASLDHMPEFHCEREHAEAI